MSDNNDDKKTMAYKPDPLSSVVWLVIALGALYVTYSCKKEVGLLDILLALCCGPCYLVYALFLLFSKENNGCGLLR